MNIKGDSIFQVNFSTDCEGYAHFKGALEFSCIITYYNDGPDRLKNLTYVLDHFEKNRDKAEFEIIVIEQGSKPTLNIKVDKYAFIEDGGEFNKCRALNKAADMSAAPILVFNDNDVVMVFSELLEAIKQPFQAIDPKGRIFNLYEHCLPFIKNGILRGYKPFTGCILIIKKDPFYQIGKWDENFVGWGGEDDELEIRIKSSLTYTTLNYTVYHLWHPKTKYNLKTYRNNVAILGRTKRRYLKKVSALCITYGRPHLLEEAVESFLKQDYLNKELIIVNDLEDQEIVFDHPQVKIFNFKERFPTIGDKRNKSVELSSGDILLSWDDDDIYLPWMLSRMAKEFMSNKELGFIQPNKAWCLNREILERTGGWCAHTAFTRDSFNAVEGYYSINSGQDMNLINRLKKFLHPNGNKIVDFSWEEACYVFRWNTGHYHLSGYGRDKEGEVSGFTRIEQDVRSKPIEKRVELKPHWKRDYLKIIKASL